MEFRDDNQSIKSAVEVLQLLYIETASNRVPSVVFFAAGVDKTEILSVRAKPFIDVVPVKRA